MQPKITQISLIQSYVKSVESVAGAVMLDKSHLHEIYYWMQLNRILEDRLVALYRTGKVVGGVYTSRGQEAISVGTAYALEEGDLIAPMIRNTGALLVRGLSPRDLLTQFMARKTSPTGGREGNLHVGDLRRGIIAPISMLGALIPVMAGAALAMKTTHRKTVAMTYIGDGGASTGDFHEGLNFAAVQKVPLVLVIEDNGWAYSTPTRMQAGSTDLATRAPAYGVTGFDVDGNDVLAVYEAACKAVGLARGGQGPVLLVARTMRMKGHAEHDDAWYVPKDLLESWRKRDPVEQFDRFLAGCNFMSGEERDMILRRVRSEVDDAADFAERSAFPEGPEALGGVYCERQ
jgi:TPP-dependent pyruvate/acetoin dehydrogenase alpha subunit